MSSADELGPNGGQVSRFLKRVSQLSSEDWYGIDRLEPISRSAFGECDWSNIELTAFRSLQEDAANALLRRIQQQLSSITEPKHSHIATIAAMSLALSGEVEDTEVISGFGPFSEVIPVSDLGPGCAPSIHPPARTPWGRFVTRLRAIDDWVAIVELAYSVESAVGVDAINAAIEATDPQEPEFLLQAERDIMAVVNEKVGVQTSGYQLVGRVLNKSQFAEAHTKRFETLGDNFWLCAVRALGAVQSYGRMPNREFAILYTPFAGAIPIRSLFMIALPT